MSTVTEDLADEFLGRFGDDEPEQPQAAATNGNGQHFAGFDVGEFVDKHLRVKRKDSAGGTTKYVLEECPFDANHKAPDSAVFVMGNGAIGFRCLHQSCSDKKWRDVRLKFEPDAYQHKSKPTASAIADKPREAIHYRKITSAELAAGNYELEYLVPSILVAKQPCIVAGPHKALKTSILIDLAIALDRGGCFLGYFKVSRPATVAIMSGESGLATLQETANRICRAAGYRLEETGIIWSDNLPKFGNIEHLDALEEFIAGVEVLAIDPAYLAIPSGNEGSVFAQGELLRSVSDLCQRHGTAMLLAHHLRKNRADADAPPTLDEIAWSGFCEFARQWLLVGRREPYVPGSGDHKLWLSAGGSAGHSGLYGIDVTEGTQEDAGGRRWEVAVKGVRDTAAETEKAKEKRKADREAEADQRNALKLRDALRKVPEGETCKVLREATGLNTKNFAAALLLLLADNRVEVCQVTKAKGTYDGYKPTKHT